MRCKLYGFVTLALTLNFASACRTTRNSELRSEVPTRDANSSIERALAAVAANKPSQFKKADLEEGAHKFLEANAMIMPVFTDINGRESDPEEFKSIIGRVVRWRIVRIVDHAEASVVLMNLQSYMKENFSGNDDGAWKVIAVKMGTDGKPTFMKFEEAFPIPSTVRVAIENQPPRSDRPDSYYYAEFKNELTKPGKLTSSKKIPESDANYAERIKRESANDIVPNSALAVMKSIYSGQPVIGFSADLPKSATGKASFDPTNGRTWTVVSPTFSLRRGMSAEIYDVFPQLIDKGPYAKIAEGCSYRVIPWAASAVRKLEVNGKWVDVLPLALAQKRISTENNE